jgi:hypothetical protein
MSGADVAYWPLTSFTGLQKCGCYRINSGQTAPSGLTVSAAFDPQETSASFASTGGVQLSDGVQFATVANGCDRIWSSTTWTPLRRPY